MKISALGAGNTGGRRARTKSSKYFNWIGAENLQDPICNEVPADMFMCDDRKESKVAVKKSVEDVGFEGIMWGGMDKESLFEQRAAL